MTERASLTFTFTFPRQVDQKSPRKPPQDGIVEVEWPVRCAYDDDVVCVRCFQAVHFLHEFGDNTTMHEPPSRVAGGRTGTEEGIDLVDENDARGQPSSEREHGAD